MDRGTWQATVHGVTKSWTQLSIHRHTHTHTHKEFWLFYLLTPGIPFFGNKEYILTPLYICGLTLYSPPEVLLPVLKRHSLLFGFSGPWNILPVSTLQREILSILQMCLHIALYFSFTTVTTIPTCIWVYETIFSWLSNTTGLNCADPLICSFFLLFFSFFSIVGTEVLHYLGLVDSTDAEPERYNEPSIWRIWVYGGFIWLWMICGISTVKRVGTPIPALFKSQLYKVKMLLIVT